MFDLLPAKATHAEGLAVSWTVTWPGTGGAGGAALGVGEREPCKHQVSATSLCGLRPRSLGPDLGPVAFPTDR